MAILPQRPPGVPETVYRGELLGLALGMREAGANVLMAPAGADTGADDSRAACGAHMPVRYLAELPADVVPGVRVAHLLIVRVTTAEVYRAYALPRDRGGAGHAGAATRTTGRRVGLRVELVRTRDGATEWVARGSGEMWRTRTAAAPGAAPAAANVDDDLGSGNLPLYPPPPDAQAVSRRLTRRLLAHLPVFVELQPN